MTDLELRSLSVRCPVCWAHPQHVCVGEQGNDLRTPHQARIDRYERELEALTHDYNLAEAEEE